MQTLGDFYSIITSSQSVLNLLYIGVALLFIFFISKFLRRTIAEHTENINTRYKLRKSVSFLSYAFFVVIIIFVFKKDIDNFAIAMGVIGGGIAFALQEVIVSIAGWLAITFSSFYNVGDRVKVGSITGDVIDIGILRTTLMECGEWVKADQYTGRIVRITNSYIFKDPVFNYSGNFPFLWDEIAIPIRYGSDVALVEKVLLESANDIIGEYSLAAEASWGILTKKFAVESACVKPSIFIVATDNWIEFSLRYVVDYKKRRTTKTELYRGILKKINEAGEKIKIASSTIEIVGDSYTKLER